METVAAGHVTFVEAWRQTKRKADTLYKAVIEDAYKTGSPTRRTVRGYT
jgi:hypothetical protein